jgi:membrane-bound serine protease (ClpP class)
LSATTFLLLVLGFTALFAIAAVISLWKHKQAGTGQIQLLGSSAVVESDLAPEGTVLVAGELWRARSVDGTTMASGEQVEVAAIEGHLVLVKR